MSTVSPDRFGGLWYDDLEPGLLIRHAIRRMTEADNLFFSTMTMNPQPLHLDAEYARTTAFGRPLVNSLLTLALGVGLTVSDTTVGTTVANLGVLNPSSSPTRSSMGTPCGSRPRS